MQRFASCRAVAVLGVCVGQFLLISGCGGGVTQDDMRRDAIRRPSEDDDDSGSSAPKAAPAKRQPPGSPQPKPKPKQPARKTPPAGTASEATTEPVTPVADVIRTPLPAGASLAQRRERTVANLRSIAQAFENYAQDRGTYPPQALKTESGPGLSWRVALLPHLGYQDLYEQFDLSQPWNSPANHALISQIPPVYQSPERRDEKTNYLVPASRGTVFHGRPKSPDQIEDNPKYTVFLLEVDNSEAVPWTQPVDYTISPQDFSAGLGSLREDGLFVVFGGAEVRVIPKSDVGVSLLSVLKTDDGQGINVFRDSFEPTAEPRDPGKKEDTGPSQKAVVSTGAPKSRPEPAGPAARPQKLSERLSNPSLLTPSVFVEAGMQMMLAGEEPDAMRYLHAAALTAPDEDRWHEYMRWSAGLQRPVFAVQWALGAEYTGPPKWKKNPNPIRPPERRGARDEELQVAVGNAGAYAGELANRVVYGLRTRMEEGVWGQLFKQVTETKRRRRHRIDTRRPRADGATIENTRLAPGIVFLGAADREALLYAARQDGTDVLLLYDVRTKPTREEAIWNQTSIQVIDVLRGEKLYETAPLVNLRVEIVREDQPKDDPVEVEIEKLLKFLDEKYALGPLPEHMEPKHAAGRVQKLAAERTSNPLPALVEMRFYHKRELLSREQLLAGYQALIGEQAAAKLLDGSESERIAALSRWLPDPGRFAAVGR